MSLIRMILSLPIIAATTSAANTGGVQPEYGWPRTHWPWWPTTPPATPPPLTNLPWYCNRTYGPDQLSATSEEHPDCPPLHPPPEPPTTTPTSCQWPCFCPRLPLPLPPRHPASLVGAASSSSSTATTDDCQATHAAVKSCARFLTGGDDRAPELMGPCCAGVRTVINMTAGGGDGDDGVMLECVCPVIMGDVGSRVLQKAVDPLRLMYLPVACGFALPPAMLYTCYSGQPESAPVAASFSDIGNGN